MNRLGALLDAGDYAGFFDDAGEHGEGRFEERG
jgi:hypothetical protein